MENLKNYFQKALPFFIAIIFFIVLSFIYFSPLLEGKVLPQMDNIHAKGMAQELVEFNKETGEESQWTNSMFGGMPAYQVHGGTSYNIYLHIQRLLRLGLPYTTVSILFIYMFGFYLLLLSLKFNNWQSILGGISFGFASYNIIIIVAGHITKTYAIAYMAPVIAGILMTYRKNYLWGGILTAFALGVEISTNHIQIIYYLALMVYLLILGESISSIIKKQLNPYLKAVFIIVILKPIIFGLLLTVFGDGLESLSDHKQMVYLALMIIPIVLVQFVIFLMEKSFDSFSKASAVLAVAALLAILPNITNLATTYEYGKESIRGPSELTGNIENKSSGLDKDYALAWSYGVDETATLMIPNANGGASGAIGANEKALKNVDPNFVQYVAQSSSYFGNQPFTSGPVYLGAILVFLFFFGLFTINNSTKWWLLAVAVLGILLSLGKNFEAFTDFFFYYVPLYNKFRTVSMSLVITGLAVPLLAMMVLKEIIEDKDFINKNKIGFYVSLGITAGISLIFYITPDTFFNFLSQKELVGFASQKEQSAQAAQQMNIYIHGLEQARMEIFKADAIRSFAFIIISAALLWIYSSIKVFKESYLLVALAVLFLADMWTVDKRYLNESHFKKKSVARNEFKKTQADEMILKDADPDYRVLSYLHSPFNDGYTPYYHKSIGGYHGAKLRRYQEVVDRYLGFEIQVVAQAFQRDTTGSLGDLFSKTNVLNMMNTKYVIFTPNVYELNWNSLGHAWFVDDYEIVENADAELAALARFSPKKTAIIDKRFEGVISKLPKAEFFSLDTGYILLENYKPNHLTYNYSSKSQQLTVFSEVYYAKGWNAYIDGKLAPHFRVNYILRAMLIPEGNHKIEYKFEPAMYKVGNMIVLIGSILTLLLIAGAVYFERKKVQNDTIV